MRTASKPQSFLIAFGVRERPRLAFGVPAFEVELRDKRFGGLIIKAWTAVVSETVAAWAGHSIPH
jgi:hypothetical protein